MYEQNEGTDSCQIADPRETHKRNCGYMMNEHLPEVFPSYVEELRKA